MERKNYKKGIVKRILSGDTLIVLGPKGENGLPREKRLSIYGVRAPRAANNEFESAPFAYDAKEYLRKLLAGQEIQFRSYTIEGMSFGHILFNGQNVALKMLSEGLLYLSRKVEDKHNPPDYAQYQTTFEDARERGIGIHGGSSIVPEKIQFKDSNDLKKKFNDQIIHGFIDNLTPELRMEIFVHEVLETVKCEFAGIVFTIIGSAFAKKLKSFFFKKLFNRDMSFKIQAVTKDGIIRIQEINLESSWIKTLLTSGYGDVSSDATTEIDTATYNKYLEWVSEAKTKQVGFWTAGTSKASAKMFNSPLIEAVSGDIVVVKNPTSGEVIRLNLSNIKAPKLGSYARNVSGDPYGFEAKEYLRKKFVGKQVKVILEFDKTIEIKNAEDGTTKVLDLQCGSIFEGENNISEKLIEKGYARFMPPREDDPGHSAYIMNLKAAEDKAIEDKVGIHSTKTPPIVRFWDLTIPDNKKKVLTEFRMETGLEKIDGVIENILTPTRFKIRLDHKNCIILLQLNGVRSIKADPNMPVLNGFADEALIWVKEHYLQRNVKIEIENIDKLGNCHGTIYLGGDNITANILENGYAYVKTIGRTTRFYKEYEHKELEARKLKLGLFGHKELINSLDGDIDATTFDRTPFKANVTEYISPTEFYLQNVEKSQVDEIQEMIAEHHGKLSTLEEPVNKDTWCLAPFDGCLFRCKIVRKKGFEYVVTFVDFGNSDTFMLSDLKKMPSSLSKFPPQAIKCSLAYIKTFNAKNKIGSQALTFVQDLVWEKKIVVTPQYKTNDTIAVLINPFGKTSHIDSVNFFLIDEALACIDRDYALPNDDMDIQWGDAEARALETVPELQDLIEDEQY